MRKRIVAAILLMVMAVSGCGHENSIDDKTLSEKEVKQEEVKVEMEEAEKAEEISEMEDVIGDKVEESILEESVQTADLKKTEKKEAQKTEKKKETTAPTVTTPVVSEPVATTPEVKACEHLYEAVEWEEYTGFRKMVWGCNGCGFPLFTIDPQTHDAVNIPDLYFHRECYSEKLEMMCPKPCGWHSEQYYMGYCYRCHDQIQMRCCDYFYKNTEYCVKNAGDLGGYEKVESDCAYIKSCSCGQNILMSGGEKGGLMLKREVCKYCGDVKTYP